MEPISDSLKDPINFGSVFGATATIEVVDGTPVANTVRKLQKSANWHVETLLGFETTRDKIKADRNLSAVGKKEALRLAAEKILEAGFKPDPKLENYREQAGEKLVALRNEVERLAQENGLDPVIREMREREIRDHVRHIDDDAAGQVLMDAAIDGDAFVYHAIVDGPLRVVNGNQLDQAKKLWEEFGHSDAGDTPDIKTLKEAVGEHDRIVDASIQHLKNLAGMPRGDQIVVIA